jgi:hypothetical protein
LYDFNEGLGRIPRLPPRADSTTMPKVRQRTPLERQPVTDRRIALVALTAALVFAGALSATGTEPEEDIDPSDLEIGQIGKIGTQGGKVTYYSLPENPIGDGEVIVEPRTKEGPGRPFILRHVDVKKFPGGKAVQLEGRFKVVATRTYRDRFRYVLEPAK